MKIKNWSRKRSHKLDEIGVGRIGTFPFPRSDSAYDSVAYDLAKTRLSESEQKRKDKPITVLVPTLCDWFSSSASASESDNLVFTRS